MTTLDDAINVRWLLSDPSRWCQGAYREGNRMCASAMMATAVGHDDQRILALENAFLAANGVFTFIYNDNNPHSAVLAAVDRTIAHLRRQARIEQFHVQSVLADVSECPSAPQRDPMAAEGQESVS